MGIGKINRLEGKKTGGTQLGFSLKTMEVQPFNWKAVTGPRFCPRTEQRNTEY